ncbi:MAG: GTPase HflX [candidate division Zixibacteria bacterium RBG_16_53_22]|nr:MAG: GTPase HflX [candidate division Zixibacteria bacterium RBG_16_53_22]
MRSFFETSKKKVKQRAIIVGVSKKGDRGETDEAILDELASLCGTAGALVVGRMTQLLDRFNSATMIGSGKVDELAAHIGESKANLVVFDTILSPSQQANLEKRLGTQVIDRPALILDIFAIHAKTREARTQVELAQMQYILPRLAGGWTHLERQEGAIGTRGPGETQLETDRRLVRKRIKDLKKKLENIEGERHVQRKGRGEFFNLCLVGYTNAGKSTLFNRLTGEDVVAEDYLFATLDSTTRKVRLPRRNTVLISDTVGFIRNLPVPLVASFKSTLLEASEADLLIHVIDISDRDYEERIGTVTQVLDDIGCRGIPVMPVFNKIDKQNDPDLYMGLLKQYPGARFVSASSGEGLGKLKEDIENYMEQSRVTILATMNPHDSRGYGLLQSIAHVSETISIDGVIQFKARLPKSRLGKLKSQGIEFEVLENHL